MKSDIVKSIVALSITIIVCVSLLYLVIRLVG